MLSQSRGLSPGRDPESPQPKREQSRGKGELAEDTPQTQGPETPTPPQPSGARPARSSCPRTRPGATTSCLSPRIASTSSEQPARAPASQATLPAPSPTRDIGHGAPATMHGPASRQLVIPQGRGCPCRSRAGDRGTGKGVPGAETWRSSSDRRRGEGPPPKPALAGHRRLTRNTETVSRNRECKPVAAPSVHCSSRGANAALRRVAPQAPRSGIDLTLNRKLLLHPEHRLPQEAFPDCSVKSYAHSARSSQAP